MNAAPARSILVAALVLGLAAAGCGQGPSGNLLTLATMADGYSVVREQRLVDGAAPAPDSPIDDYAATIFLGPATSLRFDLGSPTPIEAIQLLAAEDSIQVEISADGESYGGVDLAHGGSSGPMEVYAASELGLTARFVKLSVAPGRGRGAVGEVMVFRRSPSPFPRVLSPVDPPTHKEAAQAVIETERLVSRIMLGLGLAAIPLLLLAHGAPGRRRTVICLAIVALGMAGWLRLGTLRGDGRWLHAWDLAHYQLGSKYFQELGYRELYRCTAAWERQQGRGFLVDRAKVRDLDDYRLYPGTWTAGPDGTCRAELSDDRWQSFGSDLDDVRRLFSIRRLHRALRDHGYNATPLQTLLLETLQRPLPAGPRSLLLLSLLDVVAIAGSIWCLWRAFGPVTGAAAALLIGFGDSWGFSWTGGSLGRYFWLFALCAGLALLRRRRFAAGSSLLAASGLLRLFPIVFFVGLALWAWAAWHRGRRRVAGSIALGFAATLVVGLALPSLAYGPGVYGDFFDNTRTHAGTPPWNHMGLGVVASAGLDGSILAPPPAEEDAQSAATDRGWRRLGWVAGILVALLWLIWALQQQREAWETLAMTAPLLFAGLPLSSYDYVWLVVLTPFAALRRARLAALLGFAVLTNFLPEVLDEGRAFYLAASLGVAAVLLYFCVEASRPSPAAEPRPST
ncbi:MAG: hypothetical protein GY719_08310 [bacterium]|nr:hypothetical protein [bacterium]